MKIELTQAPYLSVTQIGELASNLDAIHSRVIKAIERLNKDVAARKAEIAARWSKASGMQMSDRAHYAEAETVAAIGEIKDNSQAELDGLLKSAAPAHNSLVDQKAFYDSPVKVLARQGLGDPRRTEYLQQLQHAGASELGHMAQLAVSTKNATLAAAVLSLVDRMPTASRPFGPVELAEAMQLDDYVKARQYFKAGDVALQSIIVAIRVWKAGKTNPLNTVSLALQRKQLDALSGGPGGGDDHED
jgi:hypothetical protein